MNKDPISHFPHAFLFLTCQGLVTRLDEKGGGNKNQMKESFFPRHLEEVERDREWSRSSRDGECKRHKEEDQRGGTHGESERGR